MRENNTLVLVDDIRGEVAEVALYKKGLFGAVIPVFVGETNPFYGIHEDRYVIGKVLSFKCLYTNEEIVPATRSKGTLVSMIHDYVERNADRKLSPVVNISVILYFGKDDLYFNKTPDEGFYLHKSMSLSDEYLRDKGFYKDRIGTLVGDLLIRKSGHFNPWNGEIEG